MNQTEKELYRGMKNASYSKNEIKSMKNLIAEHKACGCEKVTSVNLGLKCIRVKLDKGVGVVVLKKALTKY